MLNRNCLIFFMSVIFFGIIFGSFRSVSAQTTSGTILGRITDAQSGVVPQATVAAKNVDTGLAQTSVTNDDGDYALINLPPGNYVITVTKAGFTTATKSDNRLYIDQKLRLDIQLTVGEVSANVEVTGDAPLLQTQSTETSQVVDTQRIAELPLLGRNFLDLTRLSPGVVNGQGGNQLNISVNGQREFSNSVVVDGIEVTSNRNNDTGLSVSVDAVQEFKIQTSAYAPEFGKASGGSVLIQTQSGTNQYHGSVYEFFRPSETAARPSFATERGDLHQHNYGGKLGGRIIRDKLFFFFSYEGIRSHNSFNYLDAVPPVSQIKFLPNGSVDLSGLKDPLNGKTIPIFDPVYLNNNYYAPMQFPGNIIPANRVSKAGRAVLQKLFPAATQTGTLNGYYNNFPVSQSYKYDGDKAESKIDYNISNNDRMTFTYHYTPFNYVTGDRYAGAIPIEGGGSADSADKGDASNQSFAASETHIFSGSLVNEFRFGYSRFKFDEDDLITDQSAASSLGFGNINLAGFPQTGGLPQIQLATGYLTGGSTFKPLAFLDSNYQFKDNVTKIIGSHNMKVGLDFRFLNAKPTFSLLPTGYFYFNGAYSSVTSDPYYYYFDPTALYGNGGSDIADLLLGYPGYASVGLQLTDPHTKSRERNFYFQDSWQINKRLVFNYGVRYEYQTPFSEKDNNLSNFDPATKQILLAGRGGNSEYLINADKNNFMPRVGLAYRIGEKTVLRTGYGVYFSPENDARSDVLTKNYPFATQSVYSNYISYNYDFFDYNFANGYNLDTGVARPTTVSIPNGASSISATSIPNSANQTIYYVDPNFKTGYSQLFNVILQHELASNFTIEAGYVGSLSRKLPYAVGNLNRVINGKNLISSQLGQIQAQFSEGSANYHSLQAKLDKRFSKGSSFLVSYTFGKCIDNGPAPFNLGVNNQSPQDPNNLGAERAVCSYDAKHNLTGTFNYQIPVGKGRQFLSDSNSFVNALIGGWQVNGIYTARTGLPFNVIIRSPDGTALRPNIVGVLDAGEKSLTHYFNTGAFSSAGVSISKPGNAGRNILRGPGYSNLDFSTFKTFGLSNIREGMNLEVRFEFFNVTNTTHFANPNSVINDTGSFGQITSAVGGGRIIQFAGKINF